MTFFRRRPARTLPGSEDRTTIRVSGSTAEYIHQCREVLCEWMLTHGDPDVRRGALSLTTDQTLRIILATFVRDCGITLTGAEN